MKAIYTFTALCCAFSLHAQEEYLDKLPDKPESGKCYAKCIVPDEFDIETVCVVEYLNQKGIKTSRMIAVGYGESRLLNDCKDGVNCAESKHAKNRRTEFKFF